jgi:hypothetical protein
MRWFWKRLLNIEFQQFAFVLLFADMPPTRLDDHAQRMKTFWQNGWNASRARQACSG